MATLTIELPDLLMMELDSRQVSRERVNTVVKTAIETWLADYQGESILDVYHPSLAQEMPVANDSEAVQLKLMARAPYDERFMNDLYDTMSAFAGVDAQWWERRQ